MSSAASQHYQKDLQEYLKMENDLKSLFKKRFLLADLASLAQETGDADLVQRLQIALANIELAIQSRKSSAAM